MRRLSPFLLAAVLASCGSQDAPRAARSAADAALVRCVDGGAQACATGLSEVPSRRLLSREPYVGVSCPRAGSIACDRVGLALWIAVAARRVTATIDGRALRLHPTRWRNRQAPWIGYLRPAGLLDGALRVTPDRGRLRWEGRHPKDARVVVRLTRPDGTRAVTRVTVPLRAGWG